MNFFSNDLDQEPQTKAFIHVVYVYGVRHLLSFAGLVFHSFTKINYNCFLNEWKYDIQVKFRIVHLD